MEDISIICYNDFGIAFQWKRCAVKDFNKIQLVFENVGLFLKQKELIQFSKNIELALEKVHLSKKNKESSSALNLFQLGLDKFLGKQKVGYS